VNLEKTSGGILMEAPQKVRGTIVVGVVLDPFYQAEQGQEYQRAAEMKQLLQVAGDLARRIGASLHLVSVWETRTLDMARAFQRLPRVNWQNLDLERISEAIHQKIQESCEQQLQDIAQVLGSDITVSQEVMAAKNPAQGLLSAALERQASLILLGTGTKADNFFTRGFSTALTTLAETNIPVLVVGPEAASVFSRPDLRVVLAMQRCAQWLALLKSTDVLHLHVEELSQDRVRQVLGSATAELRSTVEWEELFSDLMKALDASFQERMQSRIPEARAFLADRNGNLKHEVRRCQQVREEIERAADAFEADLIIFGRHHKVHQRPYMVGRVTFHAMLSQKRAILVVT
jgi:nucleotide-binding universal stress UspA family protein